HRMLNVLVTQPELQGAGVVTVVRQRETAAMSEHVRVDRERQPGLLARSSNHLTHPIGAHGTTALGHEYEPSMVGPFASQQAQRSEFVSLQGVSGRRAVLCPA